MRMEEKKRRMNIILGIHTSDIFSVSVDEYNGRTEEFYYVCNCCVEKSQLCRYI